ncbi:type II secretion system protein GspK [Seleniivibrio sp.]|uniref:general secretion pathway protein GspK n=1 Tax=Seleniivibrio sp. TaxID=2898801 RepID=UPI002600B19A|nr:type II secretion system protein GspK [Seleniivibrio sp.]MCD8554930.1 general secretion pathway protein GspK [Seleniivibrio sp.]
MKNNKGSVLIFVLIFIAFGASVAIYIYEKSMEDFTGVTDDFYENQSHIYAMSAVTAVEKVLEDDDNSYDTREEDWAIIPLVEVPYGDISISVTPVNAKIPLNDMVESKSYDAERFKTACENVIEEESITDIDCAEILDYIDTDSDTTVGGNESGRYEYSGMEFNTKNAPLETMNELRILTENPDDYNKLLKYFTALDDGNAINLNFASAETIKMFLPELEDYAEQIADYTKTDEIKDVSNIQQEFGVPADVYLTVLPYITVKSTLFYVRVEITLNDVPRYYHALVSKEGASTKVIRFMAGLDGYYY